MEMSGADGELLRFSSGNFPAEQRLASWCAALSAKLLKTDVVPLSDRPFRAEASLRCLPGLIAGSGTIDASLYRRSPALAAADSDDVVLLVNLSGSLNAMHSRGDIAIGEGDGVVFSCESAGTFQRPTLGRLLGLRVPQAALAPQVPQLNDKTARLIPRETTALRLLTSYVGILGDDRALATAAMRRVAVAHVHDLVALALNPAQDVAVELAGRGLRAARMHAVQKFVEIHLARADIGIADVAANQGLSTRQLQRLFERDGITFSQFVLQRRLARIHAALRDARQATRTIGDIALAHGMGDISHFNHVFRRQFGATPSEVRLMDDEFSALN